MPAPDPDFTRYTATGDEAAFCAMVAAHLGMVLAVAGRKLGPHAHLAPDVAQAAFTRLARVAPGLPRDLIVAPWLHRQAVRLAIDAVRKEERRLRRETTAAMLHAPASTPPPTTDGALLLDEALDQLPAADRTVLVLRYLEDRDFASVAQTLGSTPEAVRKRIARSLEKLHALLTRRGTTLSLTALTAFLTEQSAHAAPATLSARISASALQSAAATGNAAAILTTALMSHATALTTGALAALLACGLFYQQREQEIARRTGAATHMLLSDKSDSPDKSGPSDPSRQESLPPSLPSTLPEIIAALGKITDGPNNRLTGERITALLRRVPPEQYEEFYKAAEKRIHPMRWQGLVTQSVREWLKTDPGAVSRALLASDKTKLSLIREAALRHNATFNSFSISTNREGGSAASMIIQESFAAWLRDDFTAARQWLESVRNEPLMMLSWRHGNTLAAKLAALVPNHLPNEVAFQDLPKAGLSGAQTDILQRRWADAVIDKAGDFGKALNAQAGGADAARLLAHWCARRDPAACERAIAEMPEGDLRFAAALGFVAQYAVEVPNRFTSYDANERLPRAQFALRMAGERQTTEALESITLACLEAERKDNAAVRDWVLEAGGAEASAALAAGARYIAGEIWASPHAIEWAAAIPDAAQRGPLLRGIYLRWQDADPAAAQKFLTTAPAGLQGELRALNPEAP